MWLIRHALTSLMPPVEGMPGLIDTDLDAFLDQYRRETSWMIWLGLVGGTAMYVLAPLITIGIPLPSFCLSDAQRERYTQQIVRHPIYLVRQAVFVLKMTAGLAWGASPEVRQVMNLAPYPEDPGTWREA